MGIFGKSYDEFEYREDDNDAPLERVVRTWASTSTIHGVSIISDRVTWSRWFRTVWLTLTVTSAALLVWQMYILIHEYKQYAVTTDAQTISPMSLDFPEVTVCDTNAGISNFSIWNVGIFDPANEDELRLITRQFPLIQSTSFAGETLNVGQVWKPVITEFGVCWSFLTNQTVFTPGINGGLLFTAYLLQEDYSNDFKGFVPSYNEVAGVFVFIQEPGTPITQLLPFYVINPGKDSSLQIRFTDFDRVTVAPWSRCQSRAPEYTQTTCYAQCHNQIIREQCHCRTYQDSSSEARGMRFCQPNTKINDFNCTRAFPRAQTTLPLQDCFSTCTSPPCREKVFDVIVGEIDQSQLFLSKIVPLFGVNKTTFLANYVGVIINYSRREVDLVTESISMTPAQLLSNLGGTAGLFLGVSWLSLFEILGDFVALRLIPRLFGYRHVHGLGAKNLHRA